MDSNFMKVLRYKKIDYMSIAVNSGSKRIIKLMNRKYDIDKVKDFLKKMKKMFPHIKINLDIMVGFPSETERDFRGTLRFVLETKPDNIRVFRYTDRPGAKSKHLGKKISPRIMIKREKRLCLISKSADRI